MACTGAVVALAAVTIVPARYLSANPGGTQAAGPASTSAPSAHVTPPPIGSSANGTPDPADSKPSWPAEASGDATADSGPRYQKGKALLNTLLTKVPSGYEAPAGKDAQGNEFRSHQAAIQNPEWTYQALVTLSKGSAAGRLLVEVHEPNNKLPEEPCALAEWFWGIGGQCQVVGVDGKKVGVATAAKDQGLDQAAAYRYPDGTVVFVAQSKGNISTLPPLSAVPLSAQQLAALTLEGSFHIRA